MTDMDVHVISLARSPDRLEAFQRSNAHLNRARIFQGIDGRELVRQDLIRDGVIAADLEYLPGALGCALSHRALWRVAAAPGGGVLTVCEDDAVLHRDFEVKAAELIERLPPGWDAIMWTWNFDSSLAYELVPDVSRCLATFHPGVFSEGQIERFQSVDVDARAFRLLRSFGIACYTVSPKGARMLDAACFPLRPFLLPLSKQLILQNVGIDVAMARCYPQANVWVSIPPLALPRHRKEASTISAAR